MKAFLIVKNRDPTKSLRVNPRSERPFRNGIAERTSQNFASNLYLPTLLNNVYLNHGKIVTVHIPFAASSIKSARSHPSAVR